MKRMAATTNSLKTLLLINMKTKRIKTTNSGVYLPDELWELVFKNLLMDDQDYNSLSLVSKQFLSITNSLRSSLTIKPVQTTEQVLNLIPRFPKLTSLNFIGRSDLDYILPLLKTFPFRLTSLKLSNIPTFPASGLLAFSTSTLKSFTCSYTKFLHSTHMFLIGNCFPQLQHIDLSHCNRIYADSIPLLLLGCRNNITHLNLTVCSLFLEQRTRDFYVPKLKVLNLSYSDVDDQTLNVITEICTGILKLSLEHCNDVGYKGVKCALRNCKKLRAINLEHCPRVVDHINVDSMLLRRRSLRKIKLPSGVVWVSPKIKLPVVSTN